jgi:hypothetical protein
MYNYLKWFKVKALEEPETLENANDVILHLFQSICICVFLKIEEKGEIFHFVSLLVQFLVWLQFLSVANQGCIGMPLFTYQSGTGIEYISTRLVLVLDQFSHFHISHILGFNFISAWFWD